MVRYELDNGLAYGLDHATGVFLSVPDYLWYGSGGGIPFDGYYQFRTGLFGLGKRLSERDMVEYMRRFDVPQKHILQLLGGWAQSGSSPHPQPVRVAKQEVKKEEPAEKSPSLTPNGSRCIRHELSVGNVSVVYGVEPDEGAATRLFLTVFDHRLKSVEGESEEVNRVAKSIGGDGDGCYLELRTGAKGTGMHVSVATMETYMRRFDVPDEHIQGILLMKSANTAAPDNSATDHLLFSCVLKAIDESPAIKKAEDANRSVEIGKGPDQMSSSAKSTANLLHPTLSTSGPCAHCGRTGSKLHCAKCWTASGQHVFFCLPSCRQAGWAYHKNFCVLKPSQKSGLNGEGSSTEKGGKDGVWASTPDQPSSIYGLLMRESAERPEFVEVPLSEWNDGYYHCVVPDFKQFFGCAPYEMGKSFMKVNSVKGNRPLPNTLMFLYRDNFLNDGSVRNECIRKMVGAAPPHPWAGPVLVIKYKGNMGAGNENPIDVSLGDGTDIVDFFKSYGSGGGVNLEAVPVTLEELLSGMQFM